MNGIGLWGGCGNALPGQYGNTGGVLPHMLVASNGNVGMSNSNPTEKLHVGGNVKCDSLLVINVYASGSISAAIKPFEIEHPDPKKQNTYRLRHWCLESADCPGGMVIYRRQITATKASTITLEMPDWFKHLVKNVIVFCSPDEHFGNAWGKYIDNNIIEVHTSKGGKYNILITAGRNDPSSQSCPQEVEYIPENPTINNDGMHPQ